MQSQGPQLALIGSGEYLPPMDAVDRRLLALLPARPRVVCLPTAAGTEGDAMIDSWSRRGIDHFARLGVDVEAVRVWNQATANDAQLAARVQAADLVYLSGGKPNYLFETLNGSLVWRAIQQVLADGGLLAGCSAGAMVQGEAFVGLPWRHGGFGLWPGIQVIPHFDELPSALVRTLRAAVGQAITVIGVDGNTALVAHAAGHEVVGAGGVTIWSQTVKDRFTAGLLPAGLLPVSGSDPG